MKKRFILLVFILIIGFVNAGPADEGDFAKKRGVWYKNRAKKSLKMFDKESRRWTLF